MKFIDTSPHRKQELKWALPAAFGTERSAYSLMPLRNGLRLEEFSVTPESLITYGHTAVSVIAPATP